MHRDRTVSLVVAAALVLAACGSVLSSPATTETGATTTAANTSPVPVIVAAAEHTRSVQSMHVSGVGTVDLGDGSVLETRTEGDIAGPGRLRLVSKVRELSTTIVVVEDVMYMKVEGLPNGRDADWTVVPLSEQPPTLYEGLDALLSLTDAVEVGREEVDGVECRHYLGAADEASIADEMPAGLEVQGAGVAKIVDLSVDVWIGVDDGLVRKTRTPTTFEMTPGPDGTGTQTVRAVVTENYSNFGEPVAIEPPT